MGKSVFVLFQPCPRRASRLLFYFAFARAGQAVYFFILPLPTSGKPFVFSFRICPHRAISLEISFALADILAGLFSIKMSQSSDFKQVPESLAADDVSGVGTDLFAEAANVDIDGAVGDDDTFPDIVHELKTGEDLVAI